MRWAASVPDHFRFAVKTPRAITHDAKLRESRAALQAFVEQISFLGPKLGPLLVQLPPSLPFDAAVAEAFIKDLRRLFGGDVVLEPRHPAWFAPPCEEWLQSHRIGRVGADPAPDPRAEVPGGIGLRYWRLHGSPQMYHSAYGESRLRPIAGRWRPNDWCVFDNTASGAAIADARLLQRLVDEAPGNA